MVIWDTPRTKLDIFNEALRLIKHPELVDLDEVNEASRQLNAAWPGVVRDMFRGGLWNFATKTVRIQGEDDAPLPGYEGYGWRYTKPDDWVRTVFVADDPRLRDEANYVDEGGMWYAIQNPLWVEYISSDNATEASIGIWPEPFVKALAADLAFQVAAILTGSRSKQEAMQQYHRDELARAKSLDARNEAQLLPTRGSWTRALQGDYRSRREYVHSLGRGVGDVLPLAHIAPTPGGGLPDQNGDEPGLNLPPAPVSLQVNAISDTALQVTWSAVGDAESYDFRFATSIDDLDEAPVTSGITTTMRLITGLQAETTYFVQVRSVNEDGFSPWTSAVSGTTQAIALPQVPMSVEAIPDGQNAMVVTWAAVPDATDYDVRFADSQGGLATATPINTLGTAVTINTLTAATTYFVQVRARGAGGVSGYSAIVTVTTEAVPMPTLPPNPANAQVMVLSNTALRLSWDASAGATSYDTRISTSLPGLEGVSPERTTQITRDFLGLMAGTQYFVQVRAVNEAGVSDFVTVHTMTTGDLPGTMVPDVPMGLTLTRRTQTSLVVSWMAVEDATSYDVRHHLSTQPADNAEVASGLTGTTHTITGLTENTTYMIQVRAQNANGASAYSTAITATTVRRNIFGGGGGGPVGSCFPAHTLVWMADGSRKIMGEIEVGDMLDDGYGGASEVLSIFANALAHRPMAVLNDELMFTDEHGFITQSDQLGVFNKVSGDAARDLPHVVMIGSGRVGLAEIPGGLGESDDVPTLGVRTVLRHAGLTSGKMVLRYETMRMDGEQLVFVPVTGSTMVVGSGYVVSAFARPDWRAPLTDEERHMLGRPATPQEIQDAWDLMEETMKDVYPLKSDDEAA